MVKPKKCPKCGNPIMKMTLELKLCDCPLTPEEEKILRSVMDIIKRKLGIT